MKLELSRADRLCPRTDLRCNGTGQFHWCITLLLLVFAPFAAAASDEPICAPGETNSCWCIDGSSGAQACKADRTGWAVCQCADSSTPTENESASAASSPSKPIETDSSTVKPEVSETSSAVNQTGEPANELEVADGAAKRQNAERKRRRRARKSRSTKSNQTAIVPDPLEEISFQERFFPLSTDALTPAVEEVTFATRCLSPVFFGSLWAPWLFNDDPNSPGFGSDVLLSWLVPYLVTLAASNLLWIGPAVCGGLSATAAVLLTSDWVANTNTDPALAGSMGLLAGGALGLIVPIAIWSYLAFWVTPNASLNAWDRAYSRKKAQSSSRSVTKQSRGLAMVF